MQRAKLHKPRLKGAQVLHVLLYKHVLSTAISHSGYWSRQMMLQLTRRKCPLCAAHAGPLHHLVKILFTTAIHQRVSTSYVHIYRFLTNSVIRLLFSSKVRVYYCKKDN